jgi:hypothetical protein
VDQELGRSIRIRPRSVTRSIKLIPNHISLLDVYSLVNTLYKKESMVFFLNKVSVNGHEVAVVWTEVQFKI